MRGHQGHDQVENAPGRNKSDDLSAKPPSQQTDISWLFNQSAITIEISFHLPSITNLQHHQFPTTQPFIQNQSLSLNTRTHDHPILSTPSLSYPTP